MEQQPNQEKQGSPLQFYFFMGILAISLVFFIIKFLVL